MTKETIKELILKWIGLNYGTQEVEDPCYNIEALSEYLYFKGYGEFETNISLTTLS